MREKPLNFRQLGGHDIRNDEVLIRGQAKLALMYLRNLLQGGLEFTAGLILNAAIFDEASEMVFAILAGLPTKVVNVTIERIRPGRLKLETKEFLHLFFERLETHPIDCILQTSILSAARPPSAVRGTKATKELTQHGCHYLSAQA
jgi:hypothetical protein